MERKDSKWRTQLKKVKKKQELQKKWGIIACTVLIVIALIGILVKGIDPKTDQRESPAVIIEEQTS